MKNVLGKITLVTLLLAGGALATDSVKADSYHTLQNGESFFSVAQSYGVDAYTLAAANGLSITDVIVPGQVLVVPGGPSAPVASEAPATVDGSAQAINQVTEGQYTVQIGDSFSSIAAAHGMDYTQLAANNGLTIDDYLVPGQVLQVAGTATNASTAHSSYYLEGYDYEPGINYPVGQCTWAVQKLTGWAGDWWGNASDWARNAAREGFAVGTIPVVGAIAVWDDGGFGHVAYVSGVQSETNIQVLEANYGGRQWIDNHRGWFNPLHTTSRVSYIYPH